jgi:hypothetical protein
LWSSDYLQKTLTWKLREKVGFCFESWKESFWSYDISEISLPITGPEAFQRRMTLGQRFVEL